ncbi:hypothetical protein TRAPUB_4751 [Trametes pubescens]|uniref:Uncharacterized protein n=1 Tax=Trametes pubescens TaxID=154538 RepID=A0A1M2VA11_TRAPU|nr:hypothetical protein TRAPUB_4751 [Trametes pubescens]
MGHRTIDTSNTGQVNAVHRGMQTSATEAGMRVMISKEVAGAAGDGTNAWRRRRQSV